MPFSWSDQLGLHLSDFLVQPVPQRGLLVQVAFDAAGEHVAGTGQQPLLPWHDLGRADFKLTGQLVEGELALEGLPGHLRYQRSTVLLPCSRHHRLAVGFMGAYRLPGVGLAPDPPGGEHAAVEIGEKEVLVRFQERAHNPLLLKAGLYKKQPAIPGLDNRRLSLLFG